MPDGGVARARSRPERCSTGHRKTKGRWRAGRLTKRRGYWIAATAASALLRHHLGRCHSIPAVRLGLIQPAIGPTHRYLLIGLLR